MKTNPILISTGLFLLGAISGYFLGNHKNEDERLTRHDVAMSQLISARISFQQLNGKAIEVAIKNQAVELENSVNWLVSICKEDRSVLRREGYLDQLKSASKTIKQYPSYFSNSQVGSNLSGQPQESATRLNDSLEFIDSLEQNAEA